MFPYFLKLSHSGSNLMQIDQNERKFQRKSYPSANWTERKKVSNDVLP